MGKTKKRGLREEIEYLAWLARVELTEREKVLFTKQLGDILTYFRKLDEVETRGVKPTYHVLDLVNVLRSDEVKPSQAEKVLRNVPQSKGRYVKAPRMG